MMVIPNLLLQKPSKNSKVKYHLKALERRTQFVERRSSGPLARGRYDTEELNAMIDERRY